VTGRRQLPIARWCGAVLALMVGCGADGTGGVPAATPRSSSIPARRSTWRPFSAQSPWNTPIESNPKLASDSATLIADLAGSSKWPFFSINIEQYGIPIYWVDERTPREHVEITLVGGRGFERGGADVPIPKSALPAVGTDKHLLIIDKSANVEWGFWRAEKRVDRWTCSVCAMADLAGSGVRPPALHNPWWMGHGARACGFPLVAGLITVDELRAGAIEHALVLAYPHIRSRYYTAPASTAQASTEEALPTRGMPCGARVQLDPKIDVDALGLSASGRAIARALQTYGAYIGDYSGAVSLYADASPTAQATYKSGLLDTYEVRGKVALESLRVLEIGPLFDQRN
jgi:hypothetical protein